MNIKPPGPVSDLKGLTSNQENIGLNDSSSLVFGKIYDTIIDAMLCGLVEGVSEIKPITSTD